MKSQRMKGQETELSKAQSQESASLGTRFLVMGSLNYDYIYSLDHIVEPGETIASVKLDKACGGKGFNQAAALAKAGEKAGDSHGLYQLADFSGASHADSGCNRQDYHARTRRFRSEIYDYLHGKELEYGCPA